MACPHCTPIPLADLSREDILTIFSESITDEIIALKNERNILYDDAIKFIFDQVEVVLNGTRKYVFSEINRIFASKIAEEIINKYMEKYGNNPGNFPALRYRIVISKICDRMIENLRHKNH